MQQRNTYSGFKGWDSADFGKCKRHWAAYYHEECKACLSASGAIIDQPLRLLELGYGNGSYMGWARSKGHVIFGVEVEEAQLIAARQAGFDVAASVELLLKEYRVGELDGIIAFDVLEHIPYSELIPLIENLRNLLKQKGWMLFRFPNGDSPFGRLNQHGDLTHVTTLGSVAFKQLANATGLKIVSVRSERIPILNIGWTRGTINLLRVILRFVGELPIQLLLNVYYPGFPRWYSLAPNLVAKLIK
jgi:SAM-dependent methyltransferase